MGGPLRMDPYERNWAAVLSVHTRTARPRTGSIISWLAVVLVLRRAPGVSICIRFSKWDDIPPCCSCPPNGGDCLYRRPSRVRDDCEQSAAPHQQQACSFG